MKHKPDIKITFFFDGHCQIPGLFFLMCQSRKNESEYQVIGNVQVTFCFVTDIFNVHLV